MNRIHRKEPLFLFVGDICVFAISLYITLILRFRELPTAEVLSDHFRPFSLLFVAFIAINFVAGLYERQTLILKNRLPSVLFRTEIMSALVGIAFFYLVPYLAIQPKTILFIYLVVSFLLMILWRMVIVRHFGSRRAQTALLIAVGREARELRDEVNQNKKYGLFFKEHTAEFSDGGKAHENPDALFAYISENIEKRGVSAVVIDTRHSVYSKVLPRLYPFALSGVSFFDIERMYEDIFDRVPLSLIGENWFVENVSSARPKVMYDAFKRVFDIVIGGILGIISLVFYPFVCLAIKLDDHGSVFIVQERIGKNCQPVRITKFRSMSGNDGGNYTNGQSKNTITRVGRFLRNTRIDELPQLWDVVLGKLSLIGPRPELPALVSVYEKDIPYYAVRHLITPGLSGWAQIYHDAHPHHQVATEDTADKLSYDLFYIKNRSILLDLKIALRTLQILMMRTGR